MHNYFAALVQDSLLRLWITFAIAYAAYTVAESNKVAGSKSRTKYPPFAVRRSSSKSLPSLPLERMVFIISMIPAWISAKVSAAEGRKIMPT